MEAATTRVLGPGPASGAVDDEARLQALAVLGLLDTPAEERFDRIVRVAQRVFDVPTVLVTLIDEDRQFHKARLGFDLTEIPRPQSFCAHTVETGEPLVVEDAGEHPVFRNNPLVQGEPHVRFYAGQPLRAPSGARVGALCVMDSERRHFSAADLQVLRDLADLVEAELGRPDLLERGLDVQRELLPRSAPQLAGYQVAGACVPAAAVGGDFYDWHAVDRGVQFVIADVMGKGIPAAIIASSIRALLRGASRFNTLADAVERVAGDLEDDLANTSTFATLFASRLDPATHELTYVDAGHGLAGIVTAAGDVVDCTSDELPLGAPRLAPYSSRKVAMAAGDTLVCVSDGLLDLFDTLPAAREALRMTVLGSSDVEELVARVTAFGRRSRATDDLTVIAVRRNVARVRQHVRGGGPA